VLGPAGRPDKDALYTVDGQWSDTFVLRDARTKQPLDTYCARDTPTTPLRVAPLEQQGPLESRRAWRHVAAAIARGDMDTTGAEKSLIENQQRELRRQELATGREWERRYFSRVEHDAVFDALAHSVGERIEPDKTGGIWRWDAKKYEAVKAGHVPSPVVPAPNEDAIAAALNATAPQPS
jgi:hypothetical protein